MIDRGVSGAADLDESELLHLALHAMRAERHDEATRLLKRARENFPRSARALYLLGAEHAQMGLLDRAVSEMAEAVQLDPGLAAAHFQLGLLHATAGRAREAEAAWTPLDQLPADDPLRTFKSALLHLLHDEFAQSIAELKAGIARNQLNEALNDDMRRLLADLENRTAAAGRRVEPTPPVQVPGPTKRLLLSAYDRNRDDASAD
jgi:tetratricopeptide (TPR) repeat protein